MAQDLRQYLVKRNLERIIEEFVADPILIERWLQFASALGVPPKDTKPLEYGYRSGTKGVRDLFTEIMLFWILRTRPAGKTVHDLVSILEDRQNNYIDTADRLRRLQNEYIPQHRAELSYIHAYFDIKLVIRYSFMIQFYRYFKSRSSSMEEFEEWYREEIAMFCDRIFPEYKPIHQMEHIEELKSIPMYDDQKFVRRVLDSAMGLLKDINNLPIIIGVDPGASRICESDLGHFLKYTENMHLFEYVPNVILRTEINNLKALCTNAITAMNAPNSVN